MSKALQAVLMLFTTDMHIVGSFCTYFSDYLNSSFICFSVADNGPHGTLQNRLNPQIQAATVVQEKLQTPLGQQRFIGFCRGDEAKQITRTDF